MKASLRFKSLFILCLSGIVHESIKAQCPNGGTPQTITYDTSSVGSGNNSYNFSLPKFKPSLGTLLGIKITTKEGLNYSYSLQNGTPNSESYKVVVMRVVGITSDALESGDISHVKQDAPYTTIINPGQYTYRGPVYMSYTSNYNVPMSDFNNFQGTGTVDYSFVNATAASVQGQIPWNLNFTFIQDTTKFSVTYTYCSPSLLDAKDKNKLSRTVDNNKDQSTVRLFPNPASGSVAINIPEKEKGNIKVTLYSASGQQFGEYNYMNGGIKNITLGKNVARGIYFVETKNISTGNRYISRLSVS